MALDFFFIDFKHANFGRTLSVEQLLFRKEWAEDWSRFFAFYAAQQNAAKIDFERGGRKLLGGKILF